MGSLLLSSACALQDWSLFPPVLWKPWNQILLALSTRFPGDSISLSDLQAWKPDMVFRTFTTDENFFCIIVLQSVGHPPGRCEIWFHRDCTPSIILQTLLLCLWMWGIFFLVGPSVFLLLVVQQLVTILVLSQEEITTCPSILPYWTGSQAWSLSCISRSSLRQLAC